MAEQCSVPCGKRIAVIGGGYSGMTAVVALKEEGHDPVCFEKTDSPGGTWCYREYPQPDVASIMPTTIINHSKEMGAYSDCPPPASANNYMRHWELYRYFCDYWDSKQCKRHLRTSTEVVRVVRTADYDRTGRWTVVWLKKGSSDEESEDFDGVMVCVGHINSPKLSSYPGQGQFKGKVLHSHDLKGVQEYQNQTVLVVGIGCSGLDAAVETSNVARQVYLSTRSGAHILNRVGVYGYPVDTLILRRCFTKLIDLFPPRFCSWLGEKVFSNQTFHENLYRVRPKYPIFAKDPIFNDIIFSRLLSGAVKQVGDIDHFTETGVVFEGDSHATNVDVVIFASGYTWKFPFLEEGVLSVEEGVFNLYKCMYPVQLPHPSLCFIGFILPFGPIFPCLELQSRWAARVFSGHCDLPDQEKMLDDVKRRHAYNLTRYLPNDKMTIRVDFTQYMDEIASQFGAKPNLLKLMFTDPSLFCKMAFGPCVPYQYRLQGPHSWQGARDAIMKCEERIAAPFEGGKIPVGYFSIVLNLSFRLLLGK